MRDFIFGWLCAVAMFYLLGVFDVPLIEEMDGQEGVFLVECPGCKMYHMVHTKQPSPNGAKWTFDGNMEKPTLSPSLMVRYPYGNDKKFQTCHSFIRKGEWQFLNDCTHDLAGKTVPMVELD